MIKLLRIDDRLIHGQVAMAWTKFVSANHIIVVDDASAQDKMKKMILTLAKPAGIDLDIVTVAAFPKVFEKNQDKQLMIVTGSPKDAQEIVSAIFNDDVKQINLGGLRYAPTKEKVNEYIALTSQDKIILKQLKDAGIKVLMQATPTGKVKEY